MTDPIDKATVVPPAFRASLAQVSRASRGEAESSELRSSTLTTELRPARSSHARAKRQRGSSISKLKRPCCACICRSEKPSNKAE